VKYGPAGQTITVSVALRGSMARVTVADEGPGVPAREREAIWTPFFRGDAASAQGAGGSGIGLAIVKDLVAQMGARVEVGQAPTRGAAFHVDIPAGQRAAAATPPVDATLTLRPS
jgi:signal transduction histidine kinase